ncbi:MAG: FMN-binding protein [Candidatus Omnitrophota bacterium]
MKSLKIIVFVVCLGLASGGLLVALNDYTAPIIAKNEDLKFKSSLLDALDIDYSRSGADAAFEANVEELSHNGLTVYRYLDKAVAFEFRGPGLWGPISGILSMTPYLDTILNIKILHQEETPGLGGRIVEQGFLKQFRGKKVSPSLVFRPQGKAVLDNEVDAITGATGTSKALERLLNETITRYRTEGRR